MNCPTLQHSFLRARPLPALSAVLLGLALLGGCASQPAASGDSPALEFIVVRHAEKVPDGSRDPALTDAGQARARALGELLSIAPLQAAYSTDFKRTRQTAQPAAQAHQLELQVYDAKQDPTAFATQLRAQHSQGSVLVVGHSDTVPGIVAALCACTPEPMPETEYNRLSVVSIGKDGKPMLKVRRYDVIASP